MLQQPIGHEIFHWSFQNTQSDSFMLSLTEYDWGIQKIMHCGILINSMPYYSEWFCFGSAYINGTQRLDQEMHMSNNVVGFCLCKFEVCVFGGSQYDLPIASSLGDQQPKIYAFLLCVNEFEAPPYSTNHVGCGKPLC